MSRIRKLGLWAMTAAGLGLAAALGLPETAAKPAARIRWENTGPPPGVHFYWYEPSFYTGFAPRCQEPERIHLRLARGNVLRLTVVLGDEQLDAYLEDLMLRRALVDELIARKVLRLTTNREYEAFVQRLDELEVPQLVASRAELGEQAYRARSVEVLTSLNPGRILHFRRPAADVLGAWKERLVTTAATQLGNRIIALDMVNDILPGRVELMHTPPELAEMLPRIHELARAADRDPDVAGDAYHEAAQLFLEKATGGRYRVVDGHVQAYEFTAVYPVGTEQTQVEYRGKKIPDFGVTGALALLPRDRGEAATGMVDYISTRAAYGYLPLLAYQEGEGSAYNAIHNAGVRCVLGGTSFLPREWNSARGTRTPGQNFTNLWIVSRGPVSRGCTRMGSGHVAELRHVLPSASARLESVLIHRNLEHTFDVFDVNGDGTPEVMGVKYYLAYSITKEGEAARAWAPNRREAFYEWLYAGELQVAEDGTGHFDEVPSSRFVDRRAEAGRVHGRLLLHEAEYEPERIQFYQTLPVGFTSARAFELHRELRRAGVGYEADRKKLLLAR
jgi:hypothetical protein